MHIHLNYGGKEYHCDLSRPLDISIPVGDVRCFYAHPYIAKPYESGSYVGSVEKGSPVNFYEVNMNPHGHGTHTEGLGHITRDHESISEALSNYHFIARLITIPIIESPEGDHVITADDIKKAYHNPLPHALIIRTLPNPVEKRSIDYSGTNPAYLDLSAIEHLVANGVKHLLLDLPSVDKEEDEGKLVAHRAFWNVVKDEATLKSRKDHTITELIYVPAYVEDGLFLLNIQTPSMKLDAVPSRPVLYKLTEK